MNDRPKLPPAIAKRNIARLRRRKDVMDGVREALRSAKEGKGVRSEDLKRKRK